MSWDGWKSRVDNYKERPNQTSRSLFDIAIICQRIHCCDAYVRWKRKSTVGATWRRIIKTHQIKCMLGHTICTRAWYYSWTMQFGTRHTILAIREQTLVNIQNSRKIELRTTDKKPGRRFMFFCEKTYVHITSKTHHHSSLTIHHSICNRISDCLPSNPDNRLNCDYFMYRFFFVIFFFNILLHMNRLNTVHIVIFRPNIAQCDAFYIFIKTKSVAKEVSKETVHSFWDNVNSNMKYSEIFFI